MHQLDIYDTRKIISFLWKDEKFIKDCEMLLYDSNVMQIRGLEK